ncbi:MAG: type IV conjugative transfer system protein TraE [Alphaproteobacteria bacterium]|nr:type IV conjugative transfer system protein TraE [Alphaproteobacteria bacterium]
MDLTFTQNRYLKLLKEKDVVLKILFFSLTLNSVQMLERVLSNDKIVLVPPNLSQEVWVMGGQTSKSYLEEWALYLSSTLLNISPETAPFHHESVLKYVHPKFSGILRKQFLEDAKNLKDNKISTSFTQKSIHIEQKTSSGTAFITGDLSTFVGSKLIETKSKKFELIFETSKSTPQLALISFKEIETPPDPDP